MTPRSDRARRVPFRPSVPGAAPRSVWDKGLVRREASAVDVLEHHSQYHANGTTTTTNSREKRGGASPLPLMAIISRRLEFVRLH